MLSALQGAIPDVYVGDDGVVKILFTIEAAQLESAFLANQLLLEEIFVQTASGAALKMHGETYALPMELGTFAEGDVIFTGDGGTLIEAGATVGADPGNGMDVIPFAVEEPVTIPDPGEPTAITALPAAVAGNLSGTYEYVVSFLTVMGETLLSDISAPSQPTNQQVNLTQIPIGGPGTTGRRIYRRRNGIDPFKLVTTLLENISTTYTDNVAEGTLTTPPPEIDTAHRVIAEVVATFVGSDGNVVPGAVRILMDVPPGITDVINTTAFLGGADPETVEQYRTRLLAYIRMPRTGSTTDLKFWAESVNEVEQATVFNNDNLGTPTNGHATIRISGPAGEIPDAETLAEVTTLLNQKDLANITLHVTTFTQVPIAVTVDVTTDAEHTLGEVIPSVQDAINDYINSIPIAGTFYRSGAIDAVYGLDGITDVTISVPASNQVATVTQKFIPGTITVT
jgi:uncharacterized phage protein gp47/JayE